MDDHSFSVQRDLWDAQKYDENSKLQQTLASRFLKEASQRFKLKGSKPKILDIGSGNGRISTWILDSFPGAEVIGIDSSPDMVRFANSHFRNPFLTFQLDRAEELKTVQNASIDAILSFFCLHWVHDLKKAFHSMYRVLKPGGWIGLTFSAENNQIDHLDEADAQVLQEEPWKSYFLKKEPGVDWHVEQLETIRAYLEELGFNIEKIKFEYADFFFEDKSAFKNWIEGTFQQLKILPKSLQSSCANRIAELYLEKTAKMQPLDGRCLYPTCSLEIIGQKS